ncbi:sugar transferase [Aerococcus viridans]|uniref:sugar transferase n=1 Tax=Aerococcus viridans TaxID=1377 RepID=UPI003B21BD69
MKKFYGTVIKRLLDSILTLIGLIVLSPILIIVAILVRVKLGGPVLFTQDRVGKNSEIFKLYKFRTMTSEVDSEGKLLPDEVRLTKFGKTLRSTSLDELPELWNIIKGDMSIVGPRPLLVSYIPLYSEFQARRHEVRPGLTGLAQVNGRNAISWPKRFEFDVEYVDTVSFWLDVKILFQTVGKVFKKEGISSDSSQTMEPFRGEQ